VDDGQTDDRGPLSSVKAGPPRKDFDSSTDSSQADDEEDTSQYQTEDVRGGH